MAPKLKQFNVSYSEVQDRLLLKVSTSENEEYRAWCTRRFTRLLLDHLEKMFEDEVVKQQVVPKEARREVAKFEHSGNVAQKAFQQPYEAEPATFPLGEEGLLLTRIRAQHQPKDVLVLTLSGDDDKGFTINADKKMRHQLYELFSRAASKAMWYDGVAAVEATPEAPVVH